MKHYYVLISTKKKMSKREEGGKQSFCAVAVKACISKRVIYGPPAGL